VFEIVFLGTSASAPSVHRGLSAAAVLAGEERFLVDCGEGTQRQILRAGIGFKRLNRMLLTHAHLDHILGVAGIVSTYTRWETMADIHIWGSPHTIERVRNLLYSVVLPTRPPNIPLNLHEIERPGVIYEAKHFTISAFPVMHRGRGCLGYVFQERDHRPFLAEKAAALGVPFGPERSLLVRGESITLADGRVIHPDDVLGETIKGTKVVFTGDTAQTNNLREVVAEADALVIEATFLHQDAALAAAYGHITAAQAATLAAETGVKGLLLNHISRRYGEKQMIAEAQAIFPNAHVVRDLDRFRVGRGVPLEKVELDPNAEPEDDLIDEEGIY
jgi:ribonuclease Z